MVKTVRMGISDHAPPNNKRRNSSDPTWLEFQPYEVTVLEAGRDPGFAVCSECCDLIPRLVDWELRKCYGIS